MLGSGLGLRAVVLCALLAPCAAFALRLPAHISRSGVAAAIDDASDSDDAKKRRLNKRRRYHADHFASRSCEIVVAEHVDDYRAAVEALVRPTDVALEVGCAGGKSTASLGRRAAFACGVDKSCAPSMLAEQRSYASANVNFAQVDATDLGALLQLSASAAHDAREAAAAAAAAGAARDEQALAAGFSVILVDISGSAKLSAVLDLVDRYEAAFESSLRLVIIKSYRFASLLDRARPFEAS